MELIADSGSSKTSWILVKDGELIASYRTMGLNPYFHTLNSAIDVLKEIRAQVSGPVEQIYFYGSGCSSAESAALIKKAFLDVFPDSDTFVEHDLLAAARALCGNEPGIAAILGTGSNCCYYDGKNVVKTRRALGFVLGDEGSGSNLGIRLLKSYLNEELPVQLTKSFLQTYSYTDPEILKAVYSDPFPNRFLARFAQFVTEHSDHPFMRQMLEDSFGEFFSRVKEHFPEAANLPIHVVGSIGYYNRDILQYVCTAHDLKLGTVLCEPIEALMVYHG